MAQVEFVLNGEACRAEVAADMPLLWLLRDVVGLTGTKYGCGIGACGACSVHLDGEVIHACDTPLSAVAGRNVTTIEGLARDFTHPVQQAWLAEDVPQCGYCQSGQMMTAAALLARTPHPTDADIDTAMANNICRCGTYQRIRSAIHRAAQLHEPDGIAAECSDDTPSTQAGSAVQLNTWIAIDADNRETITISKAEMGQGVRTALAMLVAEELEADWKQVQVTQAPVDAVYGRQLTVGSSSIVELWESLRKAGASARERLMAASAQQWHVDTSECRASAGLVNHEPTDRRLTYGEIAAAAALLPEPAELMLKSPPEFRLIGRPLARIDSPQIVSGAAQFGQDIRVPGMLYAVVARSPVLGASLQEFDASAAMAVPGVRAVVPTESGVAVVGETTWAAMAGCEALTITWNDSPNREVNSDSLREQLQRVMDPSQLMPADTGKVIECTYELPPLAHAAMEPLNCVADVHGDRCRIWVPTQDPAGVQRVAAQALGLPSGSVTVNQTLLGGAFGHKVATEMVSEAVQVSQQAGAPVQLVWSRSDDMKHGHFRPPSLHTLRCGLDLDNHIVAWSHALATDGMLEVFPEEGARTWAGESAMHPYDFPDSTVEVALVDLPLPTLPWRSVFFSQTVFANESFIDELSHEIQRDPYALRREHIRSPRLRHVVEIAADRSNWGERLPAGTGRGMACFAGLGSFIATVVELAVETQEVRLRRVVCAVDCGIAVNPLSVEAQIQGDVVDGLATALKAEITVAQGSVHESSFLDYQWLRMGDMPLIDVHIVSSEENPGGVGELGYPPVAAAVANAVFSATGKRVRRLPIRL